MKFAPISSDLVIKLALAAAGVGLVWYALRQSRAAVSGALSAVGDAAREAADSVVVGTNPTNANNWINRGVTAAGSAAVSADGPGRNADGSWTVGGWLYDITHANPIDARTSETFGTIELEHRGAW